MLYLIVAIVAVVIAVFTMQNTDQVTVSLLIWRVPKVPLAAVVLFSVGLGIVLVGVPLWFERWRLRSRLRAIEARAASEPPRP
jgi:uncharacterized integral membrane protein